MTGAEATRLEYVFPLDADDLLAPGALGALARALDEDTDAAVAWGDTEAFGDLNVYQRGTADIDPWLITYLDEMVGSAALFRRDRLLEAGGWKLRGGFETWDLWMTFAERGWRGVYVPTLVLRYRIHGRRRLAQLSASYDEIAARLRGRHPELFGARRRNWRASTAPWRLRVLLPILAATPGLPERHRHRLGNLISHPDRAVRVRLQRLRRRTMP
jgi:hypothetical protein